MKRLVGLLCVLCVSITVAACGILTSDITVVGAHIRTPYPSVAATAANPASDYTHGALAACAEAARTGKGTIYVRADGSCYFIPTPSPSPAVQSGSTHGVPLTPAGFKLVCYKNYNSQDVILTIDPKDGNGTRKLYVSGNTGPNTSIIKMEFLPGEYPYGTYLAQGTDYNYHPANGTLTVRPEGLRDKLIDDQACDEVFWSN